MSFNLWDDFDTLASLTDDVANVGDVLWTANERREHYVDLRVVIVRVMRHAEELRSMFHRQIFIERPRSFCRHTQA